MSSTTGATSIALTAYPFGASEFIRGFSGVRVAQFLVFCIVFCLIVLLLLYIVLSFLQFTGADYLLVILSPTCPPIHAINTSYRVKKKEKTKLTLSFNSKFCNIDDVLSLNNSNVW